LAEVNIAHREITFFGFITAGSFFSSGAKKNPAPRQPHKDSAWVPGSRALVANKFAFDALFVLTGMNHRYWDEMR